MRRGILIAYLALGLLVCGAWQQSGLPMMGSTGAASATSPTITSLGTANGNFTSPYSITLLANVGTGQCVIVDLINNNANGGTTYAVNVTDSQSNVYPTTGSGWYQVLANSMGHTLVIAPVTHAMTTSDHLTITVPVGDGNTGVHAWADSLCPSSGVVDQAVTGNVTNTNTPASSTLTPGTSPTVGFCAMAANTASTMASGNIIGSAATSLGTTQNTAAALQILDQWLILSGVTAGTCTMTGTGSWNYDYIFLTVKE